MERSIILNDTEIKHKIRRIAFQIYEANTKNKTVVLAGISDNGFLLAKQIKKILEEIAPIQVLLCEVNLDKHKPLSEVTTSLQESDYRNKSLVLIDDVLNSGTTLMYAVRHFLNVPLKQFNTAVLVDRNHKKYPVKADFKGISLSTSLQEHVDLEVKGSAMTVYLD